MKTLLLIFALALSAWGQDTENVVHYLKNYPKGAFVRCSLNKAEVAQASIWGWRHMDLTSETWTALDIHYDSEPTAGEISRCVNEIAQSKPTQRYLQSFVNVIHQSGYKGLARQWQIHVADKVVCFLGVPEEANKRAGALSIQ